jgi:hypothetical protein
MPSAKPLGNVVGLRRKFATAMGLNIAMSNTALKGWNYDMEITVPGLDCRLAHHGMR